MWVRLSLDFNMAYLDRPLIRYRVHGSSATANTDRLNRGNRQAAAYAVDDPRFREYPAHFRAKLLFYRFATAWRVEPKPERSPTSSEPFMPIPSRSLTVSPWSNAVS